MAGYLPLEVQRNGSFAALLTITDDAGEGLDLTGAEITMGVHYASGMGGDALAYFATEIIDAANGAVDVLIQGSQFIGVPGQFEPVVLAYDLKVTQDETPMVLMRGPLTLLPGVS